MGEDELLSQVDETTVEYRRTEEAHAKARKDSTDAIVAALKGGAPPTEVANRSPFTATHVRKLARDNGVEAAKLGRKKAK